MLGLYSTTPKRRLLAIAVDLSFIPLWFAAKYLSKLMLSTEFSCGWARIGLRCVSCGGTHFAEALLNGRIIEAFSHNQFLFILGVFFALSLVLLNLWLLFDLKGARMALKKLYNIPSLIIWMSFMFVFFIGRNLSTITFLLQEMGKKL